MIPHKIYLIVFLIFINLKIANRLYYKLMQKLIISLDLLNTMTQYLINLNLPQSINMIQQDSIIIRLIDNHRKEHTR